MAGPPAVHSLFARVRRMGSGILTDTCERADLAHRAKSGFPLRLAHLQGAPFTLKPLGRAAQGTYTGRHCSFSIRCKHSASNSVASLSRISTRWLRSCRRSGNRSGEGGKEQRTERAHGRGGGSQPSLEGHTHEWRGGGPTREDELMNGRPGTSI